MEIWAYVTVLQTILEICRSLLSGGLSLGPGSISIQVSRSFRPFIGLFCRGSLVSRSFRPFICLFCRGSLGHNQCSTGLLALPVSASLHHLRIQQTNKTRLCRYFFKGLDRRQPCGRGHRYALVPHSLSLFTPSLKWATISRV